MLNMGDKAKERITGFQGVITGKAQYISGCAQVLLVPPLGTDGSYREGQWFDEQRVELLSANVVSLDNTATPGPDKAAPKR